VCERERGREDGIERERERERMGPWGSDSENWVERCLESGSAELVGMAVCNSVFFWYFFSRLT
jgi:hypothetical protein